MISIQCLLLSAYWQLHPRLPLSNIFLIDQDSIFLDHTWNDIGRIIETPPLDSLKGLQMPLGPAGLTHDFLIVDMESRGPAWLAHADCRDDPSGLGEVCKEGNLVPIIFVFEAYHFFLLHHIERDGDFSFLYLRLNISHDNFLPSIVDLPAYFRLRGNPDRKSVV